MIEIGNVTNTVRILPDKAADTVLKMQTIHDHQFTVVKSHKPMVIIGDDLINELNDLRDTSYHMELLHDSAKEAEEMEILLNNMIDRAIKAGIPKHLVTKLRNMIMVEFRDVWKTDLKPGDRAAVPPIKVTLH